MRTFFSSFLILVFVQFSACSGNSSRDNFSKDQKTEEKVVKITIEGMSCMACVGNVKKIFSGFEGVKDVKVSLLEKNAIVKYDPKIVTIAQLRNAINNRGYKAGNLEE